MTAMAIWSPGATAAFEALVVTSTTVPSWRAEVGLLAMKKVATALVQEESDGSCRVLNAGGASGSDDRTETVVS
jgi:hypothetical protein